MSKVAVGLKGGGEPVRAAQKSSLALSEGGRGGRKIKRLWHGDELVRGKKKWKVVVRTLIYRMDVG